MLKKTLLASTIALAVGLAGCGGSDDAAPAAAAPAAKTRVDGPLDPVQSALSDQVLAQLGGAAAGTPLEGVVACADAAVAQDALDLADAIARGLQDAATTQDPAALAGAADDVQAMLGQLAGTLQGLLGALAGGGDCSGAPAPGGGDPLAGTPLAPLGAALQPVLDQILAATGGGGSGPDLQLGALATLAAQLDAALQSGLAQVPAESYAAPVVGGTLLSARVAVHDLALLIAAASTYNDAATRTQLQRTLEHTLVNLLLQVVPVTLIEAQAGQDGLVSGPVAAQARELSTTLADNLGTVTQPVLEQLLAGALEPALDPVENQLLPVVVQLVSETLADSDGLPVIVVGPTGTPLDPVLVQLAEALQGIGGGGGLPCLFAGTPLALLCL